MHVRFVPRAQIGYFYFLFKCDKVGYMDPETKQILKENLEISKENNDMLKKMVRSQKLTNIYRVVYWGIIIFSSLGAYYFIKPFLGNMLNIYTGGVSGTSNVGDVLKSLGDKQQMQDLINSLK